MASLLTHRRTALALYDHFKELVARKVLIIKLEDRILGRFSPTNGKFDLDDGPFKRRDNKDEQLDEFRKLLPDESRFQ